MATSEVSDTIKIPAAQLRAGDRVLMHDGEFVAIDNLSIEHTEGGAQKRQRDGSVATVFEFDGNEVTIEYVNGEFATFWESDELTIASRSLA